MQLKEGRLFVFLLRFVFGACLLACLLFLLVSKNKSKHDLDLYIDSVDRQLI